MYRILIVEDDKMLNSGIAVALKGEDMEFLSCYNLRTARELLSREQVRPRRSWGEDRRPPAPLSLERPQALH